MRALLVLIDGLGDDPISQWCGRTPFEKAEHPVMDEIAAKGSFAQFSICEQDIVPESCSCILRLLGVDKKDMPTNRAYLELLAHNRDISEYEMVLRCNLAVVDDAGRLAAFNGAGLDQAQMRRAAQLCDDVLKDIEFIHLSEYRNLLIMNREQKVLDCNVRPPHESVGEDVAELLAPLRKQSLAIDYFLKETTKRLEPFAKKGLHYILYPWGASARQTMPSFAQLHGFYGGAVCKAEIVAGIARALGLETIVPFTATGDVDTDLAAKAQAAIELLQRNKFVLAHFNGSDEASHRYDYQGKADFIARIDREFLQVVADKISEPTKVVICGDHVTSSVTGRHDAGCTPVVAGYLPLGTAGKAISLYSYGDILDFLMKESD
ncbi:phosphoglycerate mutase [Phascolarctobacterium sp.]|uniref:phosphoglycerate mutase n=1 Tax=Phascolarctobacterium sp. TaxID=2049039 RepID=UPI00386C9BA5